MLCTRSRSYRHNASEPMMHAPRPWERIIARYSLFVRHAYRLEHRSAIRSTNEAILCDLEVLGQPSRLCKLLYYRFSPDSHGGSHRFESYSAHHLFPSTYLANAGCASCTLTHIRR